MNIAGVADTFDQLGQRDKTNFWRLPRHAGLECLSATFISHVFPLHSHETYVMGAIVSGRQNYTISGIHVQAGPGQMCFINPGEVHDGSARDHGYRYRMIYPSVELVQQIFAQETGKVCGTAKFKMPVVSDAYSSQLFIKAHDLLEREGAELAADEQLLKLLFTLLKRYGTEDTELLKAGAEPHAVYLVKEYLMQHMAEPIALAALAQVARLSPFHLIRCFAKATGLTPYQWLNDQRFQAACSKLRLGARSVDVAVSCGYFDQSHLNRAFKSRLGITPGQFQRVVL